MNWVWLGKFVVDFQIIERDRTFLPARWIAEPLGAQVDWQDQEITITH